jgi:nucleoside-diphosphate-sugar epimerase
LRILVTGGSGVLGRGLLPRLADAGHHVFAPHHQELDLFDPQAVSAALTGCEAIYHLATRIPGPAARELPGAWHENDRLRAEATRVLADAALASGAATFILPSVTFVYPPDGNVDEDTPVLPAANLSSMMTAESQCRRLSDAGRRGIILRLGLLWGPGTGAEAPQGRYGATLHVDDGAAALAVALGVPAGIYNVVSDGERVANARFKLASGWLPQH